MSETIIQVRSRPAGTGNEIYEWSQWEEYGNPIEPELDHVLKLTDAVVEYRPWPGTTQQWRRVVRTESTVEERLAAAVRALRMMYETRSAPTRERFAASEPARVVLEREATGR